MGVYSLFNGYLISSFLFGLTLWVGSRVVNYLMLAGRRRAFAKQNGCQKALQYQHEGLLGKLLGVDLIRKSRAGAANGRANSTMTGLFYRWGNKTVTFRILNQRLIATIEPENIKTMLSIKFKDFILPHERKRVFKQVFGSGIFSTDGAEWEHSRAMIRPNFTRTQVADLDMFERHMEHLINAVPRDGSAVDLQDLFFALTMDSATEFLFGTSTNSLSPKLRTKASEEFVKAYVYVLDDADRQLRTGRLSRLVRRPEWHRQIAIVHAFADKIIAEEMRLKKSGMLEKAAGEQDKARYIFLHELLKETQDPYVLRSEVLNVLLAGRDTTAGLLSNLWHTLSKRPDIFAKLQAEVKQKLGTNLPTYSSIKDLTYLRFVLNEALRLMPSVPGNAREAACDTVLPLGGGPDGKSPIFVAKGTIISYSVWGTHRLKEFYGEDATEFKPERWATLRPGWEYLPFNGGPRICIGQQYALIEASYVTVRLIQEFPRMESRDPQPWKEWQAITLASGVGCKVALFRD